MEKITITDLRECPFCDGANLVQIAKVSFDREGQQVDDWYVECQDCNARGGEEPTLDDAKARWNGDYEYFMKKDGYFWKQISDKLGRSLKGAEARYRKLTQK